MVRVRFSAARPGIYPTVWETVGKTSVQVRLSRLSFLPNVRETLVGRRRTAAVRLLTEAVHFWAFPSSKSLANVPHTFSPPVPTEFHF
jgi:hypothetical protein